MITFHCLVISFVSYANCLWFDDGLQETDGHYIVERHILITDAQGYRYTWIHADVTVYIFAHLHTALRTEGNMLDMN